MDLNLKKIEMGVSYVTNNTTQLHISKNISRNIPNYRCNPKKDHATNNLVR